MYAIKDLCFDKKNPTIKKDPKKDTNSWWSNVDCVCNMMNKHVLEMIKYSINRASSLRINFGFFVWCSESVIIYLNIISDSLPSYFVSLTIIVNVSPTNR